MTDRKTWVISIPPVKCPDDMTGIPNYYIQIWEKYVGKVKRKVETVRIGLKPVPDFTGVSAI